MQGIKGELVLH